MLKTFVIKLLKYLKFCENFAQGIKMIEERYKQEGEDYEDDLDDLKESLIMIQSFQLNLIIYFKKMKYSLVENIF